MAATGSLTAPFCPPEGGVDIKCSGSGQISKIASVAGQFSKFNAASDVITCVIQKENDNVGANNDKYCKGDALFVSFIRADDKFVRICAGRASLSDRISDRRCFERDR